MAFGDVSSDEELHERVMLEVETISATPEFERAPVMRRLLVFLVRTTLAGGGDDLKAYSVAVDGLGRDADFDSQSDSYPRVQVGRLRKMLDGYYEQRPSGSLRLTIKTGGYKVDFSRLTAESDVIEPVAIPAPPGPALPLRSLPPVGDAGPAWVRALTPARVVFMSIALILVLSALVLILSPSYRDAFLAPPVETVQRAPVLEVDAIDISTTPTQIAQGMRVRAILMDGLHRSWIVRVRDASRVPAAAQGDTSVGGVDYRLSGQIVPAPEKGRFRLYLGLMDARSGNQIWSHQFLLPAEDVGLMPQLVPLVSTLIRPFGVIATQERSRELSGGKPGYSCLLDYERYFRDRDPALRTPVNQCIEKTVALDPTNASALAAASFLAFDPQNALRDGPARAAELARRAVAADPYSAEAHVADARVAFIAGQCRRGTESANRAITLNPYAPEVMGLLGFLLYQCDDPRAGALMSTAQSLDPDMPTFYHIALILSLLEHGKKEEALMVADRMRPPGPGMAGQYALSQTIASAARGDMPEAQRQWQAVITASGRNDGTPDSVIGRFMFSPKLRAKVIAYLAPKGVIPAPTPR
ncbi:tetratricopeptide repeat protein [Sphingobium boeckii]|uniref:Tetratricopeptide (TPR) repeat protein n=1 Tax=Sphingobium boeckii TaxID=1082345 RepID=A0A7W9ECG3_9SPHN|nr:hypothetical protein [Sphingobium boeckii]MBB5684243.1 tetratricopeptide (TPR) repeat protein [Sphingobium boeckii]